MTILRAFGFAILAGIASPLGTIAQAGAIYDNLSATSDYFDQVLTFVSPDTGFGPLDASLDRRGRDIG